MLFTLSWLQEYLETSANLPAILDALLQLGHEVEQVTDYPTLLAPFKVAEIKEAVQHPAADRLRVCKVFTGSETLQIVCGAANARAGIKVVLAPVGAVVPANQMQIVVAKIRGEESNGMLCSAEELTIIYGDGNGIIELSPEAVAGESAAKWLGLADAVVEIEVTPNRGDVASIYGLARELAALGVGTLKAKPLFNATENGGAGANVKVVASELCPLFTLRKISGIKNGPSPQWMQQKLRIIGQQPISLAVDVTNYVAHCFGQPLHAYDAAKIHGDFQVRMAQADEHFAALNGKEYKLSAEILVIADTQGAQALAGVIGGASSACDAETTAVYLEAAYFLPPVVITSGRALQLHTEARYRSERNLDSANTLYAMSYAANLMAELGGGVLSEAVIVGAASAARQPIDFSVGLVASLGGLTVSAEECAQLLTKLGCQVEKGANLKVTPPSWRHDLHIPQDLVEEILRLKSYSNIPAQAYQFSGQATSYAATKLQLRFAARRHFAAEGLHEVVHWSFISPKQAAAFGGQSAGLVVANPISEELAVMRPSALPCMLDALLRNHARGQQDLQLFEVGPIFKGLAPEEQPYVAALALSGEQEPRQWQGGGRKVDFYDGKAAVIKFLYILGIEQQELQFTAQNLPGWYHPGQGAVVTYQGRVIAECGVAHPLLLKEWGIHMPVVMVEIFLDELAAQYKSKPTTAPSLSKFPAVLRDFAFIVDKALLAEQLTAAVGKASALITNIAIFDVYTGKGVAADKKSVAFMVTLQAEDKTLAEADIEAASQAIINNVAGLGGVLRLFAAEQMGAS